MTKSNLQKAIENEAEALRAAAKAKANKIRRAAEEVAQAALAEGEEAVRKMTNSVYAGAERPWRCTVGATNGGGSQMGGWSGMQEHIVLASSAEEALKKARQRASPMHKSGWGDSETAVPAWDEE